MSAIIKKTIFSVAPKAPTVSAKLDAARQAFDATEAGFTQAVLANAMDEPGAAERVANLRLTRAVLAEQIADLKCAQDAAVKIDDAVIKAKRGAIYKAQQAAMKRAQ